MEVWFWLVDSFASILVILVALVLAVVIRRRIIARSRGAFDLSINRDSGVGPKGWTLGIGRYGEDHLEWFRTFSFSPRPRYRFERGRVRIGPRREPTGREAFAIHAGHVVVECTSEVGVTQLAIGPNSLTGLLAWLEASPPGQRSNNVL